MLRPSLASTLLVFALRDEAQGLFDDCHLLFTKLGKVNAAFHLADALTDWQSKHGSSPSLVLNLGSAGSAHFPRGTIVNCTSFIQRDMDVSALGFKPYETPFEDTPSPLSNGLRFKPHTEGVCGSGDTFDTDGHMHHPWNVVDMEAFALAKICYAKSIPFGCLKYITDGADDQAATDWQESLSLAARALRKAMNGIVG